MAEKRARMKRPAPVSELLDAAFKGKPAGKRLEEGRIWLVWDAAVGSQIAGKARPVSFRDGVLTVAVASPPWMQQLTFLKTGMMEKINQQLGQDLVRDIYLKAGRQEAARTVAKPEQRLKKALSPAEKERIAVQTSSLADPDLREAFSGLLALHLKSRPPEEKP